MGRWAAGRTRTRGGFGGGGTNPACILEAAFFSPGWPICGGACVPQLGAQKALRGRPVAAKKQQQFKAACAKGLQFSASLFGDLAMKASLKSALGIRGGPHRLRHPEYTL